MRIPSRHLDLIRSRLDLVEWIGKIQPLRKMGRSYKGLCPFHPEKTPSFTVNAERQLFYCFGCGAGGDLFAFVMKREGLSFPEALQRCAQAAHVVLPDTARDVAPSERDPAAIQKKRLLRLNALASEFFSKTLAALPPEHPLNRYLSERALSSDMVARYRLGYAPPEWQGLVNFLHARQAPLAEAATLGLVREKNGRYYDFFRDRLIFPIVSHHGAERHGVLGFGARRLAEDVEPKYLNSPESPIYHKGQELYGLHDCDEQIRREGRVFIVEGYMDFLAMAKIGLPAVAPLGTALTETQVRLLKRSGAELILAFDSDRAGFQAVLKSSALCIHEAIFPRVLVLDAGEDPDSMIRTHGAEAMQQKVAAAPLALDYMIDWLRTHSREKEVQNQVITILLGIVDPIERARYLEKVAAFFGVSISDLQTGFRKISTFYGESADTREVNRLKSPSATEKQLINALLGLRSLSENQLAQLHSLLSSDDTCDFLSDQGRAVLASMLAFYERMGELPTVNHVLDAEDHAARIDWLSALMIAESETASLQIISHDLDQLLKKIAFHHLKNKLRGLTLSIEQAERQKNIGQMATLLEEKMKLISALKQEGSA